MSTATAGVSRPRKPAAALEVTGRFVAGATWQDLADGAAVLAIIMGDTVGGGEVPYWCRALFRGEVHTGFRLTKFGASEGHVLDRGLTLCSCPDRHYQPLRPNGCRHLVALRQAVAAIRPAC